MAEYTLPDLDYDYGALAPSISGQIMELHHSKHHATYVKGANTALEKLAAARESGEFGNVNQLSKDLAFNLGGHTNHSIFWKNLSPEGGDKPTGELASAIDEYFGSFDASASTSPPLLWASRAPAGRSWRTSRPAATWSSSSSTTSRTVSRWPRSRCSSWTCGSTPSTSTTRT